MTDSSHCWIVVSLFPVSVVVNREPPVLARPVNGGPLYVVSNWDSAKYRYLRSMGVRSVWSGTVPKVNGGPLYVVSNWDSSKYRYRS